MDTNKKPSLSPDEFATMAEVTGRDLSNVDMHESSVEGKKITDCVFRKNNLEDTSFVAGTELCGCVFDECALVHTVFSEARLTDVCFRACTLDDVFFEPGVVSSLRRVHFPAARITTTALDGCSLPGSDFSGAELTDVGLANATFTGAKFRGAVLERVALAGSQLSGADFAGATFVETALPEQADLTGASFAGVDARDLDFAGQKLANVDFADANLRGVSFRGANLDGARFTEGTMLDGADFSGVTFAAVRFESADLSDLRLAGLKFPGTVFAGQVNFDGADLSKCLFEKCAFSESLFTGADLRGAVFDDCTFSACCFDGAKLGGISFVRCMFDGATIDGSIDSSASESRVTSFSNTMVDEKVVVLECAFKEEPQVLADAIKRGNSAYAGKRFDDPKAFKMRAFAGKDFTGTAFVGLSLKGACFAGSTLAQTKFEDCDLSGAHFCVLNSDGAATATPAKVARFEGTVFSSCKMDGAVLAGVEKGLNGTTFEKCSGMGTTQFSGSSLAGATFRDVKFAAAVGLAGADLRGATLGGVSFAGLDLGAVKLCGVHVAGPLDFTGATLGSADFGGEDLGESKFTGAALSGVSFEGCDLTSADFCGATLAAVSFSRAKLPGPEKFAGFKARGALSFAGTTVPALRFQCPSMCGFVFSEAVLSGVAFDGCDMTEADLTGVVFEGVSFSGSQLGKKGDDLLAGFTLRSKNAVQCDFSKCRLAGVDFTGMALAGYKFAGATLERVRLDKCDLTGADFDGAVFADGSVFLAGAQLRKASFRGAQLSGLSLKGLRLGRETVFAGATLSALRDFSELVCRKGLDLGGVHLANTDFGGRSLAGFSFRGATLEGVNMRGCNLEDADFEGAVFRGRVELAGVKGGQSLCTGTDFSGATVCGVSFAKKHLRGVKFVKTAFLDRTTFAGASIVGCAFDGCDLTNADFTGAVTVNCTFADARLPEVLIEAQRRAAQLVKRCLRSKRIYDGRRLNLAADPLCSAPLLFRTVPDDVWRTIPIIETLDLSGNDLEFLEIPQPPPEPRAAATAGKTLRTLCLRDNKRFSFARGGLACPSLRNLDISGTACAAPPGLHALRDLAALRSLTAARLAMSSLDAAACLPPSLTALDVSSNSLTGLDLRALPRLRSLSLARNSLTALPLLPDGGAALTALDVSDNSTLTIADGNTFAGFSALTALSIRGVRVNCASLSLPRSLTSLDVTGVKSKVPRIAVDLAATPALSVLHMRGAPIVLENFRAIEATLTAFEASVDSVAPVLGDLAFFVRLGSLALSGDRGRRDAPPFVIPEGVLALPALCSLSLTDFGAVEIPEGLATHPTLQELVLERDSLEDIPDFIFGIPSLRMLYIGGNPCSDNYDKTKNTNPNLSVITREI